MVSVCHHTDDIRCHKCRGTFTPADGWRHFYDDTGYAWDVYIRTEAPLPPEVREMTSTSDRTDLSDIRGVDFRTDQQRTNDRIVELEEEVAELRRLIEEHAEKQVEGE